MADDDKTEKTEKTGEEKPEGSKETPEAKGEKKDETFTVTVAGEDKLLTLQELKDLASKSAGADEKFRSAASLRDQFKEGSEIKDAFTKVFNARDGNFDMVDVRKLAQIMDIEPDQMEKMFKEELEKQGGNKKVQDTKDTTTEKLGLKGLDEETRGIMEQARADQISAAEVRVEKMCKEGVDKDEFFGKIMKDAPDDMKDNRKAAIVSMVQQEVRGKILASPYTKEKFGPEMIKAAIQGVRATVKKFGIPSKSDKQLNLNLGVLGLGPTGQLPAEVHSDEKIERVASDSADYEDNVVKRLGQKMVQSIVNRVGGSR